VRRLSRLPWLRMAWLQVRWLRGLRRLLRLVGPVSLVLRLNVGTKEMHRDARSAAVVADPRAIEALTGFQRIQGIRALADFVASTA